MRASSGHILLLGVFAFVVQAGPVHAFGRLDCFVAPGAHRPLTALIRQIDMDLALHRPAETRACDYYARGLLYHFDGQPGRAIADYTSAIGWMQSFEDAYVARADAYDDVGEESLAAADYARAKTLSGDSPEELMERCWIRALRGHPLPRALVDCNAALKPASPDFNALSARCLVYERMGSYVAAIADCNAALALKPLNPTALFVRGLAESKSGNVQGGRADVATAHRVGDSVEETFALYGNTP